MDYNGAEHKAPAKYGVGDKLYYIEGSNVESSIVTMVWKDKWGEVYYGFRFDMGWDWQLDHKELVPQYRCFKTKAALIKSL